MDILLSLPIISFFFSSSATSWSTSLNLLFFYMTWSTLVLSYKPLYIQTLGTFAIRTVFFLIPSLIFLLFDTLLPSLAESIKHGGASALPPRDARILSRTLFLALANLVLESALEAASTIAMTYLLGGEPPFRTTTTLPFPFAIFKQLGWLYLAREVLAYYIHRCILHADTITTPTITTRWRKLTSTSTPHLSSSSSSLSSAGARATNYIATQHARYAHARAAAPYSLSLAADHPLPFLLYRFAPVYLPAALIIRPHLLVYFLFVGLITLEETLTMSGYTIVPGIIMGGITRRNAAHYRAGSHHHGGAQRSSGNYGAWGVLDWGCGTGLGGRGIQDDVREEATKHRVRERGQRKASDALEAVGNGVEGLRKGKARGKGRKGSSSSG